MKQIISFLAVILFCLPSAQGQTLSLATLPTNQELKTYSSANFMNNKEHKRRKMCAATIVGISSLTVGIGMAIGGLLLDISAGATSQKSANYSSSQYQHDHNTALAVTDVGMVLAVTGIVVMICGISSDMQYRHHRGKFGLIAPKYNQMGFAYNF